jgi:hypothetical protein
MTDIILSPSEPRQEDITAGLRRDWPLEEARAYALSLLQAERDGKIRYLGDGRYKSLIHNPRRQERPSIEPLLSSICHREQAGRSGQSLGRR